MRALLDESVPKPLADALTELGCPTSSFPPSWKGLRNGALLTEMEAEGFDRLLTSDRNLRFQQTLQNRRVAVVVLPAQRFVDLVPFVAGIAAACRSAIPPAVAIFERDGRYAIHRL